jgi:hypothetical protein
MGDIERALSRGWCETRCLREHRAQPYRRILPCENGKLAGATKSLREGLSKRVRQDNDWRSATTSQMSEDPLLPRFVVRRDARLNWMVRDRHTKGPAMFEGRFVTGLAEDHARVIRDELTEGCIAGE